LRLILATTLFGFLLLILLSSCQENPPIPGDKFVKVYSDMTIMQDTTALTQKTIRESVLKKYNLSENDYNETIKYFNSNPERWNKFFDEVLNYLQELQDKTKKREPLVLPRLYVLKDM
jgi:hypothetical protein